MTVQTPIPDFLAARLAMVENQLRPQGVTDPLVLDAMSAVERERFLPTARLQWAAGASLPLRPCSASCSPR
jgi:protein-L-isoaspartate(D-aspartate) O-methyltransferase